MVKHVSTGHFSLVLPCRRDFLVPRLAEQTMKTARRYFAARSTRNICDVSLRPAHVTMNSKFHACCLCIFCLSCMCAMVVVGIVNSDCLERETNERRHRGTEEKYLIGAGGVLLAGIGNLMMFSMRQGRSRKAG